MHEVMDTRGRAAFRSRRDERESSRIDRKAHAAAIRIRTAVPGDGSDIESLVRRCEGLDANSAYAYVMICDEFRDSCVVARDAHGSLLGFVTGFHRPRDPSCLFLWQIGVDPDHRGRGLAHALLRRFVELARTESTVALETTVSPDNGASLALFASYARSIGSTLVGVGGYPADWLGDGHADEDRYRIELVRNGI